MKHSAILVDMVPKIDYLPQLVCVIIEIKIFMIMEDKVVLTVPILKKVVM